MRHTSDILKELGFNEDAPESTKRAFLKHLEQSIEAEKSTNSSTNIEPKIVHNNSAPVQLSFDFNDPTMLEADPVRPKRISHR